MKLDTTVSHIDTLLLRYLRSPAESPERETARTELVRRIDHPRKLRESGYLTVNCPLYRHSYSISDAFEAVTNGMYDPASLERLEEITADSPLHPWKTAICAILAFYQGDRENMSELLKELPEASPPAAVTASLLHLAGIRTGEPRGPKEKALREAVSADHSFIRSAAAQLREYLTDELEEAFAETSLLLIRDLMPNHPLPAKRLALWSMQTAAERGHALDLYPSQLAQIFGQSEGMRLAAMALRKTDLDIALLFLIRCLLQHMRDDDLKPAEVAAYFTLLAEWAEELLPLTEEGAADTGGSSGGPDNNADEEEYFDRLGALTAKLDDETGKRYAEFAAPESVPSSHSAPLTWLREAGTRIDRQYRSEGERSSAMEQAAHSPAAGERRRIPEDGPRQLELF